MYRYQGPLNPFNAIINRANPMTATKRSFVIVFSSMSKSPTFERGAELFITDLVSGPESNKQCCRSYYNKLAKYKTFKK